MKILTATLSRQSNQFNTLGIFVVYNGLIPIFICHSLELPFLNNIRNISSIPTGIYTCFWSYSTRFSKYTYLLENVPNRSGIRIHSGNFASLNRSDVQGCILLGNGYKDLNNDKSLEILNSKQTIRQFLEIVKKQIIILTIENQ